MNIEDVGPHLEHNSKRLEGVTDIEWKIALKKAENHLNYRLWNRTKYGAHTVENLGIPAKEYYLNFAYMSILYGTWQWKDEYDLTQQMIRIIDSRISTVVESYKRTIKKNEERKKEGKLPYTISLESKDVETIFYNLENDISLDETQIKEIENQYALLEQFVSASEDDDIIVFWECTKAGLTRAEISEYIGKKPKQIDKIKEKFLRQIQKEIKPSGK
ncbi:MAG: hypothetical protein AAFX55_15250 [Bacteroidota bacterium]